MGSYFTIEELTRSTTATRLSIDNTPNREAAESLNSLIYKLLDPIREAYGSPIIVNSGYRSPKLNRVVGGVITSQHTRGEAADITTGSREGNRRLFNQILTLGLEFDQLIDEHNFTWLHISLTSHKNRNQTLKL